MNGRTLSFYLLSLLLALLPLSGCAKGAPLPDTGLALIQNMHALASNEGYVSAMAASAEVRNVIQEISAGDYAAPKAIYQITIPGDTLTALLYNSAEDGLSDGLRAWINAKAYGTVPVQAASQMGSATLAAVSCVTYSEAIVCEGLRAPVLYLYMFGGDYDAMVSFLPGQDGAATATACFVPAAEALKTASSAQEVAAWLNDAVAFAQMQVDPIELGK